MQPHTETPREPFIGYSAAGCEEESWSPEVFSFYGDGNTVLRKLSNLEMDLPRRRVYMFTLETTGYSELAFFERTDAGIVSVYRWAGGSTDNLREKVSQAILANHGVACVGEQTKALLGKTFELKSEGTIPAPVSPRAAFGHPILKHLDSYVSVTAYLMC